MKKLFAMLLVLCMIFALVACSNNTPGIETEAPKTDKPQGK